MDGRLSAMSNPDRRPVMIVLGLLQTLAAQVVQDALARSASVLLSTTATDFASILRHRVVDVAVIDPGAGGDGTSAVSPHPAAVALASAPHVPFLLYMSTSTRSFDQTRSFFALKPTGLIMRGIDDTPASIISAVRQAADGSLQSRIGGSIAAQLERLPQRMQLVLRRIFEEPDVSENVMDLCEAAGEPRRTFDRRLDQAGLNSAWTFLAAGRVTQAYRQLHSGGVTCTEVAREMEYSSGRRLQNDTRTVLAMTPSAMRQLDVGAFVGLLAAALTRRSDVDSRGSLAPRNGASRLNL
jgi:AraC-like DNA-binding protein